MTKMTRFHDADDSGFIAAMADEVSDTIGEAMRETAIQRAVNRRILVAATRRQMREASRDVLQFGTFLDWRGRLYYHGAGLAPQGKDFGRGALMAAEGQRLGISGLRYLMVGVATTWGQGGMDKAPLRARVRGVIRMVRDGSLARIVHGARTGTDYTWRLAEEPVQFVALAADLLAALESGDAFEYESATFIGLDATCSGLQILAAVTGCRDTARLVNVEPMADGSRADIYLSTARQTGSVCDGIVAGLDITVAEAAIEANESGDHWALFWARSGLLTRSTFKTPTMVYCYGGTKRTFAAAFRKETRAPWKACMWLAAVLYDDVLAGLLPRAHAWMQAAQDMARALAKHGKPVAFVAADGLPFVQAVMETEQDRARCSLADGRSIQAVLQNRTDKLNAQRQASGVAPNIVHHWDSLFLRNAVRALRAAGITEFFTVHDCFYLRAGDWAKGQRIVRQAFVDTFSGDVSADLWQAIATEAGVALPPCPPKGDLDLTAALRSEFLFS
jgi:DNA-directed RNA polymerase